MSKKKTKPFHNSAFPSDWEMKSLGELGKFSKGKGILKEQVVESGLPCIRYGEIYTTHDFVIKEFKSFINEDVAKESQQIKKGDILFAGSGETLEEIGKAVAYVGNEKAFAGGDVIILSTNGNNNAEFISFLLETDFVRRQKRRLGQGHSVVHIYPTDLATLKLPLPPYKEQKAIADLLHLMDTSINANNLLIEKKELQKKWLMQQLLSEKRIVKNEKWCKSGVRKVELGEIGKIVSGGTPDTNNEKFWNGEINWVTPTEITALNGSKYLYNTSRKISEAGLKNSSAELLPIDSIVITTRATIGDCAINKIPLATNQGFKSIIPDLKKVDLEYLYYLLQTKKNQFKSFGSGSTFFEVSKADILHFSLFIVHSIAEQTAIAQVLQAADKEIKLLKAKAEKLREQKKGLMQVLLTGKKRLKVN